MAKKTFNVLFLCTGNSARSIIAEAVLNRVGAGRFKAYSAGSKPAGKVNPYAIDLLDKLNLATSDFTSKSWSEFDRPEGPQMDFIFTVCDSAASEACPVWPGHPTSAHWGIPDPAAVEGTDAEKKLAFAEAYRQLKNRIDIFVNLPFESLDALTLKARLEAIGKTDQ